MRTFISLLEEVITHGEWQTPAGFARASGASTPYLSDIFSGKRLPTVDTLRDWCKSARVSQVDTSRLCYLLSRDKAATNKDTRPFVEAADARLRDMHEVVLRLSEMVAKAGVKVPKGLIERIEAINVEY